MSWASVLSSNVEVNKQGKAKVPTLKFGYGCERCPLNKRTKTKVINLQRLKRRRGQIWAMCPGKRENIKGLELVGDSGKMLWEELKEVGLFRKDFDIQNIVRCRPTDSVSGFEFDRDPTKEEIAHCQKWTDRALEICEDSAEVMLVFGKVAQDVLLGQEASSDINKDQAVYWSEKYNCRVFRMEHPSYFIRGNYPGWKLAEWRRKLRAVKFFMAHEGRWSFLESCDFKAYSKPKSVRWMLRQVKKNHNRRVAVDIEAGWVNGEWKILCIGFSWKKDQARMVVLDHPENGATEEEVAECKRLLKEFLESDFPKVFHYGSSDIDELRNVEGWRVRYDFDTTYASFLKRTFHRSHGLANIAGNFFPEYADYKNIINPHVKSGNYADIPLNIMTLYNCGDAALTKRIELETKDKVPIPLLKLYTWAGVTLDRMEDRGPALDKRYFKVVKKVVPKRAADLKLKLCQMADNPEFNPGSPPQCLEVIYDKLGLPVIDEEEGRNTKEDTLKILHNETGHPFPQDLLDYRMYSKMDSTYLQGYERSANMNGGELRTKWFLTGAVTGRLRSGGTKEGFKGKVNMQNLHGSPFLQNLLVSDQNWRAVLEWAKTGGKVPEEILDLEVFLASDYSQVEIRMLAEASKDPLLCKQFLDAYNSPDPSDPASDIHCLVGHALNPKWSLDFIKADKPTRTFIKTCHFGLVYGLSENGLYFYLKGMGVDTTPEAAADFHRKYFKRYKGVARFIEKMRAFAEKHGYVETMFGFRRFISGNWDEDRETSPMNQAVNTPIQGAAHTMLLAAMALLYRKPKTYRLLQNIIMEVHDALVFRVKLRDLPEAYRLCNKLMQEETPRFAESLFNLKLNIPLLCEATVGFRYGAQADYFGGAPEEFLPKWVDKNTEVEQKIRKEFKLKLAA